MPRRSVLGPRGHAERRTFGWLRTAGWVVLLLWLLWFFFGDIVRDYIKVRSTEYDLFMPVDIEVPVSGPFSRYQLVPVRVFIHDRQGRPFIDCEPEVRVFKGDTPVRDAGSRRQLVLRFDDSDQSWRGQWAMRTGSRGGEYGFEVSVMLPDDLAKARQAPGEGEEEGDEEDAQIDPNHRSAVQRRARFQVVERPATEIARPICAVTLETALDVRGVSFRRPNGEVGDWHALFEWLAYMGANTLWIQGPTTDGNFGEVDPSWPWHSGNTDMIEDFAEECERRDIALGVWIAAMRVYGPRGNLPPYALGAYDGSLLAASISLQDEQRVLDLASAVEWLDGLEGVSYIGLDYIRDEPPAFDCVDTFVRDMTPRLPDGWRGLSLSQRSEWLTRQVSNYRGSTDAMIVFDMWNWWRAHRTAEIVASIEELAQPSKPLWAFTLGWETGIQHGQDPFMLADAGLDLDAIMLYTVSDRARYDAMMRAWSDYTRPDEVHRADTAEEVFDLTPIKGVDSSGPNLMPVDMNLVVGNQIDNRSHQLRVDTPAPQEFYQRLRQGIDSCMAGSGRVSGVFIHDLWRFATSGGNDGPYPPTEWAIASARAFSEVRGLHATTPIALEVVVPESVQFGESFRAEIRVTNTADSGVVRGIDIFPLPTDGVTMISPRPSIVRLHAGDRTTRVAEMKLTSPDSTRGDRFMVAFRAEYPVANGFPNVTSFAYVKGER